MHLGNLDDARPFTTLDGSTIREVAGPVSLPTENQSLAEASVPPGGTTIEHLHRTSEELYFFTGGSGKAGKVRTIAGRVCMDQFVLDCGDDPVAPGDVATLFGSGAHGEPTADDWAAAAGTINYEIVTRFGGSRVPRHYDGERG